MNTRKKSAAQCAYEAEHWSGPESESESGPDVESFRPLQDLADGLLARLDNGIEVSGTIISVPFSFVIKSKKQ
jgi:hypothetical protein